MCGLCKNSVGGAVSRRGSETKRKEEEGSKSAQTFKEKKKARKEKKPLNNVAKKEGEEYPPGVKRGMVKQGKKGGTVRFSQKW